MINMKTNPGVFHPVPAARLRTGISLALLICVASLTYQAAAQGVVDERLLGDWAGIDGEFRGERATIARDSIVLSGERMPLRFSGSGVMFIGPPGEEERLQYRLSGDLLTVVSDGETSTWRRIGGGVVNSGSGGGGSGARIPEQPSGTPARDRFARKFEGERISLTLTATISAYEGELRFNEARYQVTARAEGNLLNGVFRDAAGGSFEFTARLTGDTLAMKTGSTTYSLVGESLKADNPLDIGNATGSAQGREHAPNPLDVKSSSPTRALVFKEHKLTDPGLNNMVASTILVPEGWRAEGGLKRMPPALYSMPVIVDIKFTAPDGRQAHFFPSLVFDFDQAQPGQVMQPTIKGNLHMPLPQSPGAWLMEMARISPDPGIANLKLVSEEDVPEVTQMLRRQNQQLIQMSAENNRQGALTGFTSNYDTQGTKVVLTYDRDGRSYEETVLIMWTAMVSAWQGQGSSGLWSIAGMFSLRGPAGTDYLNDPELIAILGSVRINPAWQAEMDKYWAQLAQIRQKGSADRMRASAAAHQKWMDTLNETSDILMSGWKSRNSSQDRMQTRTIDAIHEQTPYTTPSGETVRLPSFYSNVYTDGNGRYLLNNDSLYEPNTDPALNGQNWQRIEARD